MFKTKFTQICKAVTHSALIVSTTTAWAQESSGHGSRWVSGNQVNIRVDAGMDTAIIGRLLRGEQVILLGAPKASTESTANAPLFCEIEISQPTVSASVARSIRRGFSACQFLSEQPVVAVAPIATTAATLLNTSATVATPTQTSAIRSNEEFTAQNVLRVSPSEPLPSTTTRPIPGNQLRYVVGSSVNLRTQADLKAEVLARMPINAKVRLLTSASSDQRFCEVEYFSGNLYRGYTACQYLSAQPLVLAAISDAVLADGKANPQFNPERAFWLRPNIDALFTYGLHLEKTRMTEQDRKAEIKELQPNMRLRKIVPEFEAMKRRLEQGYIETESPKNRTVISSSSDWLQLKASIANVWSEYESQRQAFKQRMRGRDFNESKWSQINQEDNSAINILKKLATKIELNGQPLGYAETPLYGLIHKIELPKVNVSFFKNHHDFAIEGVSPLNAMNSPVQNLSRIWKIPMQTQFIRGARYIEPGRYDSEEDASIAASWDIGTATATLTQAVWMNKLTSRGRIEKQFLTPLAQLANWRAQVGDDCPETFLLSESADTFTGGGDDYLGIKPYSISIKEFKMIGFYTRNEVQSSSVQVKQQLVRLDLAETGYYSARIFITDIDGDGIADIALIEAIEPAIDFIHFVGERNAPFPTKRVYLFNVAGKWEISTVDHYTFGCGC